MDDAPKVRAGTVEIEEDGRTILTLRTVENIDVRFELDDVTLGYLYLTLEPVMGERVGQPTRAFWRQDS